MTLPTPREIAEQVIRDNGELGLNRAAEVIVADRESVQQLIAEFVKNSEDFAFFGTMDRIRCVEHIRKLDLTGQ